MARLHHLHYRRQPRCNVAYPNMILSGPFDFLLWGYLCELGSFLVMRLVRPRRAKDEGADAFYVKIADADVES
jgi:hypothetical protein